MEWPCIVRGSAIALTIWAHTGVSFVCSPNILSIRRISILSCSRKSVTSEPSRLRMGLADDMVPAILRRYGDKAAGRVVDAWNRGMTGEVTRKEWEGRGSQMAASYVEGLDAEPWHNVDRYPWMAFLEKNADVIAEEFGRACSEEHGVDEAWVPAAEEDAKAYGPGWQKLVLQKRVWDSTACSRFPKTCEIVENCGAPSHDVFFARQRARSGIKPHTDNSNFFITAHLALEVPDGGRCWIRVGTDEKREWHKHEVLAFDSSFVHETRNDASSDRIILLIRFWHPQLTQVETNALDFIFSVLEDSSVLDQPYTPVSDVKGPDKTVSLELEASLPVSAYLDSESGSYQKTSSEGSRPAEEATSTEPLELDAAIPLHVPSTLDGSQAVVGSEDRRAAPKEAASAEPPEAESTEQVSVAGNVESQEFISVEPMGDAAEAERLDSFLADLKSEGLLPGSGTKDDVLAQGPKNRGERRRASKARRKASRPGKGKRS